MRTGPDKYGYIFKKNVCFSMKYDPVVASCYLLKCSHMDRINTLYTAARTLSKQTCSLDSGVTSNSTVLCSAKCLNCATVHKRKPALQDKR